MISTDAPPCPRCGCCTIQKDGTWHCPSCGISDHIEATQQIVRDIRATVARQRRDTNIAAVLGVLTNASGYALLVIFGDTPLPAALGAWVVSTSLGFVSGFTMGAMRDLRR